MPLQASEETCKTHLIFAHYLILVSLGNSFYLDNNQYLMPTFIKIDVQWFGSCGRSDGRDAGRKRDPRSDFERANEGRRRYRRRCELRTESSLHLPCHESDANLSLLPYQDDLENELAELMALDMQESEATAAKTVYTAPQPQTSLNLPSVPTSIIKVMKYYVKRTADALDLWFLITSLRAVNVWLYRMAFSSSWNAAQNIFTISTYCTTVCIKL